MNIKATYPKNEANNTPLNSTVTAYNLYDCPLPVQAWNTVIVAHVDVLNNNKWGVK